MPRLRGRMVAKSGDLVRLEVRLPAPVREQLERWAAAEHVSLSLAAALLIRRALAQAAAE